MARLPRSLVFGALLLSSHIQAQTPTPLLLPKPVTQALETVRPANLKSHVAYLADDRLRGRQPGTPGYQLAVDYVSAQLKKLGVQPAGDQGAYAQRVRLRRSTLRPGATLSWKSAVPTPLLLGQDAAIYPNPETAAVRVADAPLAFAGFGISAPELGYDDYAGLDVRGKIVVVRRGAPGTFASTVASASQDLLSLLRAAGQHGAVGLLVAGPGAVPSLARGTYAALGPDGRVVASRTYAAGAGLQLYAAISEATLNRFLSQSALDTAQVYGALRTGRPASAALHGTLSAQYEATYQNFDSYNVVGKITGSDPRLRDEYVVHSAHLDHLGVGTPVRGDSIYNGAHDNASGVACVLEMARLYAGLKEKPRRSVLFVLLTSEEQGLLGSAYFAARPTVAREKIVANINSDMPTIIAPLLSVTPLGGAHSTLAAPVAQAAAYLGIAVEPDPEPAQNRFIRSDQYSFVTQGIPALHLKYGDRTADGKNNLTEQVKAWRAATYHQPQDDMSGIFDFEAGRRYVQLSFLIGYQVAEAAARPTWNAGDFFGRRYGAK
ncbi:M28 family peptidase [uncultured Hymenobacter sp.]|uniref:M28 family peptidase n=1 Tax=uncultured Hymenobacter sp. TaxID=170016 RepID=UPI0035C9B8EC